MCLYVGLMGEIRELALKPITALLSVPSDPTTIRGLITKLGNP